MDKKDNLGYGNQVKDESSFLKRFDSITETIQALPYLNGFYYTQLTDVEQEIKGLYTSNREPEVTIERIKGTNERRLK
ncbi:hypothetical protein [Enterococcus sp. LJL98]